MGTECGRGFILEKGDEGLSGDEDQGKFSLRASSPARSSCTTSLARGDPAPQVSTASREVLLRLNNRGRYRHSLRGRSAAAEFCWQDFPPTTPLPARLSAKPLAANQRSRRRLAAMQTEITLGLHACLAPRPPQADQDKATPEAQISHAEAEFLRHKSLGPSPHGPRPCTALNANARRVIT